MADYIIVIRYSAANDTDAQTAATAAKDAVNANSGTFTSGTGQGTPTTWTL